MIIKVKEFKEYKMDIGLFHKPRKVTIEEQVNEWLGEHSNDITVLDVKYLYEGMWSNLCRALVLYREA